VKEIFRVEMLPAREGDCLVVSWGDPEHPRRIMVDCGRKSTYRDVRKRYATLSEAERTFELLIVSHIDRDHIEGALAMLEDASSPLLFKEIWFNSYDHLLDPKFEAFGARQGERLTEALRGRLDDWNASFDGRSVELRPEQQPVTLDGGLEVTLLSPDRQGLEALIPTWERECRQAGLVAGVGARRRPVPEGLERFGRVDIDDLTREPFVADQAHANGTSIAVLAQYGEQRVLLGADAHPDRLIESLRPLAAADATGRLPLAAFKLPHHGSTHNVSPEFFDLISCDRYLVSTNGAYFQHPDAAAVARVIKLGGNSPEIAFNYRSDESLLWDNSRWQGRFGYSAAYPTASANGTHAVELAR
jgi:hypothetical protein